MALSVIHSTVLIILWEWTSLSFFFFSFIFISWRLITLQYCSGFCHTLTWMSHGFTCIPHPDPPSHLPLHPIPLGLPSAPGKGEGGMFQENIFALFRILKREQLAFHHWIWCWLSCFHVCSSWVCRIFLLFLEWRGIYFQDHSWIL